MYNLFKKITIIFSIIVFILFISLLVTAWSLGAFAPVSVSITIQGPYYFLTTKTKTTYQNIHQQLENIKTLYEDDEKDLINPSALIYSDPTQVPPQEIIVHSGYIINDSLEVDSNLVILKISKREVLEATIDANPSIAAFKVYPSIIDWRDKMEGSYQFDLPAIEFYNESRFRLEMPIRSKKN